MGEVPITTFGASEEEQVNVSRGCSGVDAGVGFSSE